MGVPNGNFSEQQKIAVAYLPKATALLSIFGNIWIIVEVLRDRNKLRSIYHRLMLGHSCYNVFFSICTFLGTWLVPADSEPESYRPHAASGTTFTCSAQGFGIQLGIGSNFYVSGLALYYVLVIKYNWKKYKLRKWEIACHCCVAIWSFGTCIASLILKLYNNALFWCWISYYPYNCNVDNVECTRGQNAYIFVVAFGYMTYVPAWLITAVSMGMLYHSARQQAMRMKRYASGSDAAEKNLNTVTKLGISYLGVFFGLNFFIIVFRSLEIAGQPIPFALTTPSLIMTPFTGFAFVLIYLQPRLKSHVRQPSGTWNWRNVAKVFAVGHNDHELGNHEAHMEG